MTKVPAFRTWALVIPCSTFIIPFLGSFLLFSVSSAGPPRDFKFQMGTRGVDAPVYRALDRQIRIAKPGFSSDRRSSPRSNQLRNTRRA